MNVRDETIEISLSSNELRRLREQAAKIGCELTDFVRERALRPEVDVFGCWEYDWQCRYDGKNYDDIVREPDFLERAESVIESAISRIRFFIRKKNFVEGVIKEVKRRRKLLKKDVQNETGNYFTFDIG